MQLMHPEVRGRGQGAVPSRPRAVDHVDIPRVLPQCENGVVLVNEHRRVIPEMLCARVRDEAGRRGHVRRLHRTASVPTRRRLRDADLVVGRAGPARLRKPPEGTPLTWVRPASRLAPYRRPALERLGAARPPLRALETVLVPPSAYSYSRGGKVLRPLVHSMRLIDSPTNTTPMAHAGGLRW